MGVLDNIKRTTINILRERERRLNDPAMRARLDVFKTRMIKSWEVEGKGALSNAWCTINNTIFRMFKGVTKRVEGKRTRSFDPARRMEVGARDSVTATVKMIGAVLRAAYHTGNYAIRRIIFPF